MNLNGTWIWTMLLFINIYVYDLCYCNGIPSTNLLPWYPLHWTVILCMTPGFFLKSWPDDLRKISWADPRNFKEAWLTAPKEIESMAASLFTLLWFYIGGPLSQFTRARGGVSLQPISDGRSGSIFVNGTSGSYASSIPFLFF